MSSTGWPVETAVAPVMVPSTDAASAGRELWVTADSVQAPVTGTTVWLSVDPAAGSDGVRDRSRVP